METPVGLTFTPKLNRFDLDGALAKLRGGPVVMTASEFSTLRRVLKEQISEFRKAQGRPMFSGSVISKEPLTYVVWMDGTPTTRTAD